MYSGSNKKTTKISNKNSKRKIPKKLRFENLSICSNSYKNNTLKIWHS